MSKQETDGLSFRSYVAVIARWKWVVILVTVLVTAAGVAYFWTRTPMYSSTATLLYSQQIDIANPLAQTYFDPNAQQAEIQSVPTIIDTAKVEQDAEKVMSQKSANADYSVSADLQQGPNSDYLNVIGITAESPSPGVAADVANAYAQAIVQYEGDSARNQVADAITVVQSRLQTIKDSGDQGSSEYIALQGKLQDLELLEAGASGPFKVITQASPASSPFSPKKNKGAAESLVIGLVLAVGLAFLLEQFDTRLRGEDQLADILDLPIIGRVPPVGRKAHENGVVDTLTDPAGGTAEAYRVLRGNLDFAAVDGDLRTLLVSSSLQGEGKSVVACNLAVSMASAGKRIILVDADLRSPRVHSYLNIRSTVGLSLVVARGVEIAEALVPMSLEAAAHGRRVAVAPIVAGVGAAESSPDQARASFRDLPSTGEAGDAPVLRVMLSGPLPPNPGEIVASQRFGDIIEELGREADLVIVDAPAMLLVGDTAAIASKVDAMVYVVNADKVRRPTLEQASAQLAHLSCRKLGIIEVTEKVGRKYQGYYSHHPKGGNSARRRT